MQLHLNRQRQRGQLFIVLLLRGILHGTQQQRGTRRDLQQVLLLQRGVQITKCKKLGIQLTHH